MEAEEVKKVEVKMVEARVEDNKVTFQIEKLT